jgi:hypothetical protein
VNLIDAIAREWAWALPATPEEVIAVNSFGNVVVRCADGSFWRLVLEDLKAAPLPPGGLDEALENAEFRRDWEVLAWVSAATEKFGPNPEGRCFGFRIWPALNGDYSIENMVSKDLVEWVSVSGDVGKQVASLPDGTHFQLKIMP